MPRAKTLILLRHAHRDTSDGRESDNGLSKKGRRQAEAILSNYEKFYDSEKPLCLSSPKTRCIETIEPIAKATKVKVKCSPLLLEQTEDESFSKFLKRIQKFIRWWKEKGPKLTVVSSHGDWIPVFLKLLIGAEIQLSKGAWAEIDMEDGEASLSRLLQASDI